MNPCHFPKLGYLDCLPSTERTFWSECLANFLHEQEQFLEKKIKTNFNCNCNERWLNPEVGTGTGRVKFSPRLVASLCSRFLGHVITGTSSSAQSLNQQRAEWTIPCSSMRCWLYDPILLLVPSPAGWGKSPPGITLGIDGATMQECGKRARRALFYGVYKD